MHLRFSTGRSCSTLVRRTRLAVVLAGLSLGVTAQASAQGQTTARADTTAGLPYQNQSLPFSSRVDDLVGRMTLEEKVSQMIDVAPGIPRLGVPPYNWWNEALHGVARSGLATVFPQAIGVAATWNDSLVFRMASVISDEARAKYEQYLREGSRERYEGLTFWSPNINIFRDPRWGRGQETYGEDPFLTGRLAVQFVRGMQGNDPKYLKTVSTVKHFAVHSGPEPTRHVFDAEVSERDLHETYLAQFEAGIREGGAYSLMCAYNRVDGKPACASDMLLHDVLRGAWKFPGYVVSDCDAVSDIWRTHKYAQSAAQAAALAVKAGTDLDCGRTFDSLVTAVHQGLISEQQIDTAVKRLFLARFKLGMFDSPARVRWARIPFSDLDSPAHRALALKVARESIVLLKNQGHILPLRRNLGTIAVIGPNSDQWRMLLGNYNGLPSDAITPLRGIREAVSPRTRVLYARGSDLAEDFPVLDAVPGSTFHTPQGGAGLQVEYFSGDSLQGTPVFTGTDTSLDANWHGAPPRPGLDPEHFSVRWTGTFTPRESGTYRLGLIGTVRFQLYLDDSLLTRSVYPTHNGEFPDPRMVEAQPIALQAGHSYRLRVEGEQTYGDAQLKFVWAPPSDSLESDALAIARQADVVILCLGLTANLEGEEMRVNVPGFLGGDRTDIALPAPQEHLLESVAALGKPTVLVLLSGSAVAIDWAQEHVPGIVEAWYGGQAAGTAIADVLFGKYDPAGRLPVTFYRSVNDLPPFDDYDMKGRTYRYFTGTPLYPFGYGLSYTTFRYSHLRTSSPTLRANGRIMVRVDVTNTGTRTGDEVVQLYVQHLGSKVSRPIKDLRGFRRVTLRPGQTRTVSFPLRARELAYWSPDTHGWVVEDEPVRLQVGGSSADVREERTIRVVGGR